MKQGVTIAVFLLVALGSVGFFEYTGEVTRGTYNQDLPSVEGLSKIENTPKSVNSFELISKKETLYEENQLPGGVDTEEDPNAEPEEAPIEDEGYGVDTGGMDTEEDPNTEPGSVDDTSCEDVDGISGYYTQTNTKITINGQVDQAKLDSCSSDQELIEHYCTSKTNGEIKSIRHNCQGEGKMCEDGACVDPEITLDYSGSCTGTPNNCLSYDYSDCENHQDCNQVKLLFVKICWGDAISCSEHSSQGQCIANGCDFN
jgi:hypothetical protein